MAEHDKQLEARRFRELFRGRFTQAEAELLLTQQGGLHGAANFVMENEPEVINNVLNRKGNNYINITIEESKKLNALLEDGLEMDSRPRLFACQTCERAWWKKVPLRKEVSRCYRCKVKYDPIPRDKEWGRGRFKCGHCQNEFITTAIMGMTISLCHDCNYPVAPYTIEPPARRKDYDDWDRDWNRGSGRLREFGRHQHNCNGINCYNCNHHPQNPDRLHDNPGDDPPRDPPDDVHTMERNARVGLNSVRKDKPAVCIDPRSKPRMPEAVRVRTWSERHVSTGSTVTTCLNQGDLETATCTLSLAYTLLTIHS